MKTAKKHRPLIPLDRCHLYRIGSPKVLAKRIGWKLDTLEDLSMNAKYRVFRLKRSGRQVEEPPPPLQSLHRQIHGYLSRIETPNYLHSNRKGRSYISNAKPHVGALAMIKIDVKKFFPSVEQHKVMHFFRDDLKCAADVAGLLAALLCKDGKLPTGSSSSPIISYYAYKAMFDDIQSFAAKNHLVMTCYVDDITLSGANATLRQLHEVRKIIMRHGLRAHKAKWFMGLGAKPVTGVMVTKNGIELPHSRWKAIKADLKAIKQCANREEKLEIYPKLVSRLYEASQIDPGCRKLADIHHRLWKEALAGDVQLAA